MTAVPQKDLIHFLPGFSSSAMLCAKYGAAETQGACDARTHENDVLSIAEEIDAIEEKIRRAVVDGMRCPTRAANADTTSFRASPNRHKGAKDTKECAGFQKRRYNCSQLLR